MIEEFRALGGVAKNIVPGEHGLFAVDPAEPVLVRVPSDLVVRVGDVAVADGAIVLNEAAEIKEPARRFFERYANSSSLRAMRAAEIFSLADAFAALPSDVCEVLAIDFRLGELGKNEMRIRRDFLGTHHIFWSGDRVIAPLIELARYAPNGLRPERGTNLQIQGYTKREVFVRFAPQDAFSAFRLFGRAIPEAAAYSLAGVFSVGQFHFDIGRKLSEGVARGKDRVPNISAAGGKVSLPYLLLGHRKSPALPRSVFRAFLSEAGIEKPDEAFDGIVRTNALKFIRLLQSLEPHDGEIIQTLRKMARYQLVAMSYCVGSRGIVPAENY